MLKIHRAFFFCAPISFGVRCLARKVSARGGDLIAATEKAILAIVLASITMGFIETHTI
jgi:hypothetical protein